MIVLVLNAFANCELILKSLRLALDGCLTSLRCFFKEIGLLCRIGLLKNLRVNVEADVGERVAELFELLG